MHKADLIHDDIGLQKKLETIFQLRRTRSKVNWDRGQYLELLASFGNPHENLPPVIHVAGTNGKGSIISMLRSILEAQGLKVHCYTSPHLIHVNERITISGSPIDNTYLVRLIDQALEYNKGAPLSFFEITTALAFKAFSEVPADILLLEVGMGGRLDCTNVIDTPLATIINRISFDHVDFLGEDIKEIAMEKAGIMKTDVPCIIGYQGDNDNSESVLNVLDGAAKLSGSCPKMYGVEWEVGQKNDHMIFSFHGEHYDFPLPVLQGVQQVQNAGVALATLFSIRDKINVTREAVEIGLKSIQWRGRLQNIPADQFGISEKTEIWLDSGHNDSAGEVLAIQMEMWKKQKGKSVHLVLGMLDTKDSKRFLSPLLPHISTLHVIPISSDSGCKTKGGIEKEINHGKKQTQIYAHDNFNDAIQKISQHNPLSIILIVGSVYLAGEVLKYIQDYD